MEITRTSVITGMTHTRDLPVTEEQLRLLATTTRPNIKAILPDLSPLDHEFLVMGTLPEEWNLVAA